MMPLVEKLLTGFQFFVFVFFFFLFMSTPTSYGISQAQDVSGRTAVTYTEAVATQDP